MIILTGCCLVLFVYTLKPENSLYAQQNRAISSHAANAVVDKGYYEVIVDNNLFRPLGWREPKPGPQYVLIGTVIESKKERARAFIMEQRSQKYYYVAVGERIGDAILEKIEPNQISLNIDGDVQTIQADLTQFLSDFGGSDNGNPQGNPGTSPENLNANEQPPPNARDGSREEARARFRQRRARLRNASREERQSLLQQFRSQPGRSSGERGTRIQR